MTASARRVDRSRSTTDLAGDRTPGTRAVGQALDAPRAVALRAARVGEQLREPGGFDARGPDLGLRGDVSDRAVGHLDVHAVGVDMRDDRLDVDLDARSLELAA